MSHQGDSRFCREMRQLEAEQVRIKASHRDMFECYQPGDKAALETMRWLVWRIRELGQRMESLNQARAQAKQANTPDKAREWAKTVPLGVREFPADATLQSARHQFTDWDMLTEMIGLLDVPYEVKAETYHMLKSRINHRLGVMRVELHGLPNWPLPRGGNARKLARSKLAS